MVPAAEEVDASFVELVVAISVVVLSADESSSDPADAVEPPTVVVEAEAVPVASLWLVVSTADVALLVVSLLASLAAPVDGPGEVLVGSAVDVAVVVVKVGVSVELVR